MHVRRRAVADERQGRRVAVRQLALSRSHCLLPLLFGHGDFLQGLPVHRCQRDPDFLLFNFLALSFSFVLFS
jgi:hypothetical protein